MLTPTQIIEQMLKQVASYDAAHTTDTLDNSLLRVEANSLFRILRTIEETSGQRFIVTATGSHLDLIGQGMERPRLAGETDEEYRARLIYSPEFWNDCTVDGIKMMIKSYYGIDMENDEYDETRLVEPYKQAAHFFNKDKNPEEALDWEDYEGWVNPASDFGAEWMGDSTAPGAFEVHLRAFQLGEEKFLKKRQIKDEIMRIRAAGIVVFLYFHITHGADMLPPLLDRGTEFELMQQNKMDSPLVHEQYEVIITNREVSSIVSAARDKLSGKLSRRIVHDRQKNKCNDQSLEEFNQITDPYEIANREQGNAVHRSEPFVFRQSHLRNNCWNFFYGVKYEERDITIPPLISIPITALINNQSYVVGNILAKSMDEPYIVMEITGNKGNRTVYLDTSKEQEVFTNINTILDLQQAMANSKIGDLELKGNLTESINQSFRQQHKRAPIVHTYYTRPNPMVDELHHRRCEDVHGLEFYNIIEYVDFWWRVSSMEDGIISAPSIPYKLTIAKTNDGISDFWWRVTGIDGQVIGEPSKGQKLKIPGSSYLQPAMPKLDDANDWGIYYNQIDLFKICESSKQLVILEGYNPENLFFWQRSDIVSIKVSQPKDRFVLARLNIGSMLPNDPYLPWVSPLVQGGATTNSSLSIRFWENDWKKFLKWRIKALIKQGFNGIFLDGLGAWRDWQVAGQPPKDKEMRDLVAYIRNYISKILAQKNFILLAHGEEKWHFDKNYIDAIDGIVVENVFYEDGDALALSSIQERVNDLNLFLMLEKTVFVLEYLSDEDKKLAFFEQAELLNLKPWTGQN